MSDSNSFQWTEENVAILKARYNTDGPKKLAEELGTTRASVTLKARRLGLLVKRGTPTVVWTDEMIATLIRLYPTADRATLIRELGLPYHCIQPKANKLGLYSLTRADRSAKTRADSNDRIDQHFFDVWSPVMAQVLGFIFADGSITKRECEVVIGISDVDIDVLHWIKNVMKCERDFYYREAWTDSHNDKHTRAVFLTLASVNMVKRLRELGVHPRKTYRDDPFPDVPADMLCHFTRGYFDGDGCAYVWDDHGTERCGVKLIGSTRFITGLRDALVQRLGIANNTVVRSVKSDTECSHVTWGAVGDINKLRDFMYPEGFSFCLQRKKDILDKWLSVPHQEAPPSSPWTDEELEQVRTLYCILGPKALAAKLNRNKDMVIRQAQRLGVCPPREPRERKDAPSTPTDNPPPTQE